MISVIVPLYNEESVICECAKRLKNVLCTMEDDWEIVFVNDGSRDKTELLAREIASEEKRIKLVNFSRNFGHQPAITAGMDYAKGDAIVVIDADLQDPPELIPQMVQKWREGYMVVYGKRLKREKETFFKKITAKAYYRILKSLTSIDIPVDTGDFRLIDKKVCDVLRNMKEKNRYVRGLVSFAGFPSTGVEYIRQGRLAGETKYSLKKMLRLATDGIASFSYTPLKLPLYIGGALLAGAAIYFICMLFMGKGLLATGKFISLAADSLILIFMGIFGEYIGRIYEESKDRPLYIVKDEMGFDEKEC